MHRFRDELEEVQQAFWRLVMTMREKLECSLFGVILVGGLPAVIFASQQLAG
jgi:hypothetical protein